MVSKNFGSVDLGDARRHTRLIAAAAHIAATPARSFNTLFDWNDLRAFYNLCDTKTATVDNLQATHRQLTREAMGQHDVVLILHDTSEIDFTSHKALTDIGPIGDGRGRGILQHNSLAIVSGTRHILGLAHQQLRMRKPAPENETASQRKNRERESILWTNGITAIGPPPKDTRWVDVADAAADDYAAMRASVSVGHDFLFRVSQNREVYKNADRTQSTHMLDWARNLSKIGTDTVSIPARGGRAGPRGDGASNVGSGVDSRSDADEESGSTTGDRGVGDSRVGAEPAEGPGTARVGVGDECAERDMGGVDGASRLVCVSVDGGGVSRH